MTAATSVEHKSETEPKRRHIHRPYGVSFVRIVDHIVTAPLCTNIYCPKDSRGPSQ